MELGECEQAIKKLENKCRAAMRGYPRFQRKMTPTYGASLKVGPPDDSGQTPDFLERVRSGIEEGEQSLNRFKDNGIARFLSFFPWWVMLLLGWSSAIYLSGLWAEGENNWALAGWVAAGTVLLIVLVQFCTGGGAEPAVERLAEQLEKTRLASRSCSERISMRFAEEQAQLIAEENSEGNRWDEADAAASRLREEGGRSIDEKYSRVNAKNDEMRDRIVGPIDALHEKEVSILQAESADRISVLQKRHEATVEATESSYAEERSKIEEEWSALVQSIYRDTDGLKEALSPLTPAWDQKYLECWQPSTELHDVARFGKVSVAGDRLCLLYTSDAADEV